MSKSRYLRANIVAIIVAGSFRQAAAETVKPEMPASDFYKQPPLFSMRATDKPLDMGILVQSIDRFGAVGIGIELHHPAFWMKVKNVEAGSPAAAAGELKAGQIIETINGQKLKDIDPRIQLGPIVTAAEATDGKVIFEVRDSKESPIKKVTVAIPVLGAYSKTWPLDCAKSDRIVRQLADLAGAGKGQQRRSQVNNGSKQADNT